MINYHQMYKSWHILLSGENLVAVAATGSGKTMAFMIPAIMHVNDQPPLDPDDGPLVLVLAPTRELVQQISTVATQYGAKSMIRTVSCFGGAQTNPQIKQLQKGAHVSKLIKKNLILMKNLKKKYT